MQQYSNINAGLKDKAKKLTRDDYKYTLRFSTLGLFILDIHVHVRSARTVCLSLSVPPFFSVCLILISYCL